MKIEKINDNQIRCTLTRADLAERELKLSELAYGTEKAKSLFQDMMRQAASEFGFEAEDIPLMIEAIPATSDSIVLIITKVEDPEELDTRFSKFAPSSTDLNAKRQNLLDKLDGAEEIFDLINKVKEAAAEQPAKVSEEESTAKPAGIRLFSFSDIDSVIHTCHLLSTMYSGSNTLYKVTSSDVFILAITQSEHSMNEFNKICNMLSEYGSPEKASGATLAYLEEHCEVIVSTNAVQQLGTI